MPSKKKNKTRMSAKPAKKARKRTVKSKATRKSAKKKTIQKKVATREKSSRKKSTSKAKLRTRKKFVSAVAELKREFKSRNLATTGMVSPRQTEDFTGLSRAEEADTESVDELVEEGNILEAGAVAGVQEADDEDEREVHTHEVPEDDVPEEYLDKD